MFCNKCGNKLEDNQRFCNKCGNEIIRTTIPTNQIPPVINQNPTPVFTNNQNINPTPVFVETPKPVFVQTKKSALPKIIIGLITGFIIVLVISSFIRIISGGGITINDDPNKPGITITRTKNGGKTAIVTDNQYTKNVKSEYEAKKLISDDSTYQKPNCPNSIIKIEDEIISKYNITAVNFCEMDENYSKSIGNVIKKIYDEFPAVRGYITNMTIINVDSRDAYIAAFSPFFLFIESDSSSSFPWVLKTQVFLNSSYFLNLKNLETAINESSKSGHFPPNSNIYAPIAHELGHYISFIAMMKYYNLDSILMVQESKYYTLERLSKDFEKGTFSYNLLRDAYNKYKRDTNDNIAFDKWRGSISKYALAKNNNGEYIYDETIAESFHDVYTNGKNAKPASKYIYNELKERFK